VGAGRSAVQAKPAVYALLVDNRLLALGPDAQPVFRLRLGPVQRQPAVGAHLALAPGGRTLYVLVQGSSRSGDSVAFVDTARGVVAGRVRLPRRTIFRVLALAPATHRLYVVGDRPARGPQRPVVAALDTRRRRLLWTALVRRESGLDWWVYGAAVEPGEQTLLVSYHGTSTTGADRLRLLQNGVEACTPPPRPYAGTACIRLHGRIEPYGDELIAGTGDPRSILVLDHEGRRLRNLDPRLDGNHLMEFAIDRKRGLLYSVGSCGYSGGLAEVAIATGRTRLLERPRDRRICGDRIVVASPSLLAIAAPPRPVPSPGFGGRIELVRRSDGELVAALPTSDDPVDVVAAVPGA
jgi:hypothetical protein